MNFTPNKSDTQQSYSQNGHAHDNGAAANYAEDTAWLNTLADSEDTQYRDELRRAGFNEKYVADSIREQQQQHNAEAAASNTTTNSTTPSTADDSPAAKASQATKLVELAEAATLFHDADGEAYARFPVEMESGKLHHEVSLLKAKRFRRWLQRLFYLDSGKAASSQPIQDALGVLEGKAAYDGKQHDVFVRVGAASDKIYFDLADNEWRVVEIDAAGWRILDESPILFRRPKAMKPLPLPHPEGGADDLGVFHDLINITDDEWDLLLGFAAGALHPRGPYMVLAVHGEHGSAKSTLCRLLRGIIDPNTSPLRAEFREPRDLAIAANNGWIIGLDNLSHIQPWQSDCLCRLSTGGGFSTRTLYENTEETIFEARRPVILNCIEEVVTRSDLLDRSLLLTLPRMDDNDRQPESVIDEKFAAALPGILGAVLNAVSTAIKNEPAVRLEKLPRMADAARWITAAEPALGMATGRFVSLYSANRDSGNEIAIESSIVGKPLLDFVCGAVRLMKEQTWHGTATELLKELVQRTDAATVNQKTWPQQARTLSGIVRRIAPNLRQAGIGVEFTKAGKKCTRLITLTPPPLPIEGEGNFASASSASSAMQDSPASASLPA
jgi:hypothetical protein